jgi:hypothetical protein
MKVEKMHKWNLLNIFLMYSKYYLGTTDNLIFKLLHIENITNIGLSI